MTRGIYMIKNKQTGQIYIGQSTRIERRWKEHCQITDIDYAILKEGVDNFEFSIIEEIPWNADIDLLEREKYWIEQYDALNNDRHYNTTPSRNRKYNNTTGYYRVSKKYDNRLKQGFSWRYTWREDGKLKSISSVDIHILRRKVQKRKLPWRWL